MFFGEKDATNGVESLETAKKGMYSAMRNSRLSSANTTPERFKAYRTPHVHASAGTQ
ncbi:MAG: hypothetical protein LBL45_11560 [Treponema sp.]|nr:hypothetical protein [Treponema sp.]